MSILNQDFDLLKPFKVARSFSRNLKTSKNVPCTNSLDPFESNVTFLYPPLSLKTSENHRFSDIFRGYRNVTLDLNGLNTKNDHP